MNISWENIIEMDSYLRHPWPVSSIPATLIWNPRKWLPFCGCRAAVEYVWWDIMARRHTKWLFRERTPRAAVTKTQWKTRMAVSETPGKKQKCFDLYTYNNNILHCLLCVCVQDGVETSRYVTKRRRRRIRCNGARTYGDNHGTAGCAILGLDVRENTNSNLHRQLRYPHRTTTFLVV